MMKSYRLVVLIGAFGLIVTLLGESPGPAVMSLSQDAQAVSLPDGASTGWWAAVQDNIRESEYHVTWQDHTYLPDLAAAYQTPNRAHNLRTYFAPDGVRLCRVEPEQETSAYDQDNGHQCAETPKDQCQDSSNCHLSTSFASLGRIGNRGRLGKGTSCVPLASSTYARE